MFDNEHDWLSAGPAVDTVREQIRLWLAEDTGSGDVTSMAVVPANHMSKGIIHTKNSGIIAGLPLARLVFDVVDPSLRFEAQASDGEFTQKGKVLAIVEGSTRSILSGERLALNLLQRLSGIATTTNRYVSAAAGLPVRISDTRKTTPGHRTLEKYAVRAGGGSNHRFGLYDAVMIKDNHIKAAGGITAAVQAAKSRIPHTMMVEVEAENLVQTREAAEAGAHIIMLDNMSTEMMTEAVALIRRIAPHVIIEASGGITTERVAEIGKCGVDVISVGALTHSFQALDISLDLNGMKKEEIL